MSLDIRKINKSDGKRNKHMRNPRNIDTIKLSNTTIVTTLNKLNVAQAMTAAWKLLDNIGTKHYNHTKMIYQRLILEVNGGGIRASIIPGSRGFRSYTVYNGLPCYECRLLIPINTRTVRRRAGAASKYLHAACYERLYHIAIPLLYEAEMEAMKMGLYPAMRIPATK